MLLPIARASITRCTRLFNFSRAGISVSSRLLGVKPTDLKMPALSPTMTEGTIIKWLKKEGDTVNPGDALCEIQTDKAVMAFEIEEQGILAKILMPDDSKDVKVGTLIALVVEEGENWKDVEIPAVESAPVASEPHTTAPASKAQAASPKSEVPARVIGPAARNVLHAFGLDGSEVRASGPHGSLLKSDVLNFVEQQKLSKPSKAESPAPKAQQTQSPQSPVVFADDDQPYIDIPLTNMRLTIAKRLTESKWEIPHVYAAVETCMDPTMDLRRSLQADGIKVSINDFVIKAVAVALQRVPQVNAQWANEDIKLLPNIDISVAVATESGLITPIIKNAIGLGVSDISKEVKELADRAKKGKLKPQEFIGGTFTISNLGMFGISEFTAIINPPQSAILAVGTSRSVLSNRGWNSTMTSQMSYDGRVITAEVAAVFLEEFSKALENPGVLLGPSDLASFPVRRQLKLM